MLAVKTQTNGIFVFEISKFFRTKYSFSPGKIILTLNHGPLIFNELWKKLEVFMYEKHFSVVNMI